MVWILLASTLFFKGMSNVLTPSLLSSTNSSEATESVVGKVMAYAGSILTELGFKEPKNLEGSGEEIVRLTDCISYNQQ